MSKSKYIKIGFHIIVLVIMIIPPLQFFESNSELVTSRLIRSLIIVIVYCLNVFWLIPNFLQKRKYYFYSTLALILVVVGAGLFSLFPPGAGSNRFINPENKVKIGPRPQGFAPDRSPPLRQNNTPPLSKYFFPFLMALAIGTSFEMILKWEKQKRMHEETEKQKIIAELLFLKSQINPHFFFNTINNIYSLAVSKSKDTEKAILLLSNLMRYVLYESNGDKTVLKKDINFIENFIALQQLRFSKKKSINISFEYTGDVEKVMVEPMLFLPFIENAFKHGISYKAHSFINISISVDKKTIVFFVENSIADASSEHSKDAQDDRIGLANTYKRLHLLYPEKHELEVSKSESVYKVSLIIYLT